VLIVVFGAAAVAAAYCLLEASMTPGYHGWLTGARATPLSTCLTRDFPAIFLVAAASLAWITRNRGVSRK
jgi:hypothetical protein